MLNFVNQLFGDKNQREIRRKYEPVVTQIHEAISAVKALSDDELRDRTEKFRAQIQDAVAEIEERKQEIQTILRTGYSDEERKDALTLEDRQDYFEELDELEDEWLDVAEDTLNEILPDAFALIKEVCRRLTERGSLKVRATEHDHEIRRRRAYPDIQGSWAIWPNEWEAGGTIIKWEMIPYDVQLIGGVVLHNGNIAEMKTGEGKTLVAVAPVYLNALLGRGVHLITVNPYLAQRDSEWMGPIFEFLGLTVDVIDEYDAHSQERRSAYRADITYGTNNEFGFDYLRDNSFVIDSNQLVQRGHHFAIVDEVDSVLVDEARTPLIISGPVPQSSKSRFDELKPAVDRLVHAQKRLVAGFVSEAEKKLKERDLALERGEEKEAKELESEAGLSLLRAARGFPRNKRLMKILQEPGVEQLRRKTEYFYLQDNAKRMPIVDDAMHYALDEKQHALEPTDQGREFIARAAGEDVNLFILPDVGEETARLKREYEAQKEKLYESIRDREDLSDEKREHKLQNDLRVLKNKLDEETRKLYSTYSDRAERLHAIEQLLKAYTLYERDTEYIVQDGKVQIVDTHTGRVLSGRRYSDGLHQAIEAKEGVKVQAATQTYATITLQNYFRMYSKLAGMTGTAETEAEEFHKIYKMDVVVVPTNKPIDRDDLDDLVFRSKREKYGAVIEKIEEYHDKGQPVLVGTTSVEVSETLSRMLKRARIQHNVLNAKRDRAKQESLIVAEAGKRGAVTIATNMAGRGTDIKLGDGIVKLGGLAIIGTERHESRRIDLQLRGRSGRQGDPGESQFYVSLEDDLMRLFGPDRVAGVMDRLKLEPGAVITHPWVTKSIERAQKKVEQNNFAIRKRQLEYDDVLNSQREVIYDRRMHALKGERFRGEILDMLFKLIERLVKRYHGEGEMEELRDEFRRLLSFDYDIDRKRFFDLGDDGVTEDAYNKAVEYYEAKRSALAAPFFESMKKVQESNAENKPERAFVDFSDGHRRLRTIVRIEDVVESEGQEINDSLERTAMLSLIDEHWTEHLRSLDEVKEGIGLRAYGQRDPLIEYKMEAFRLFAEVIEQIGENVVTFLFRAGPVVEKRGGNARQTSRLDHKRAQARQQSPPASFGIAATNSNGASRDPSAKRQPVLAGQHVGRNAPCPCGSGKKHKQCCGRI
ncbi:MAG: preprotein translocase subunit SecA [Bacteroidetes bacterium]|nr:preprotein translocase subunit SecA [Bacteroidota bacterium]MCY4204303.1 preprotein translocase subunit SecA [Bacteroidota bacterium]